MAVDFKEYERKMGKALEHLDEENSIIRVVRGEDIGTTVKNEF